MANDLSDLPRSAQDYIRDLEQEVADQKARHDRAVDEHARLSGEKAGLDDQIGTLTLTADEARQEMEQLVAGTSMPAPVDLPDPATDPSQAMGNSGPPAHSGAAWFSDQLRNLR